MKDIPGLEELCQYARSQPQPYEDRLRSTNVREFTKTEILVAKKKEFVRDTTLDPK